MNGDGEGRDGREGPPDTRPYLCLPYWSAPLAPGGSWDTGRDRPLPGGVVYYLCDAIHAGPYVPGQPLDVTVDVRNSGGGNSAALATVVVYWAVPTAGFGKPRFFAATVVAVPPTRTTPGFTSTPRMTAVIPADAPAHICLLVVVSHPQDRAGTGFDPVGDRHWAQRNLQAAVVAPGAPALLRFMVGNPFVRERSFVLAVGPADRRRAMRVAREVGTELADASVNVRLLDQDGAEVGEGGKQALTSLGLGPREEHAFQVLIEVGSDLPRGQSVVLEALLLDESAERVAGALGIVLTAPEA